MQDGTSSSGIPGFPIVAEVVIEPCWVSFDSRVLVHPPHCSQNLLERGISAVKTHGHVWVVISRGGVCRGPDHAQRSASPLGFRTFWLASGTP